MIQITFPIEGGCDCKAVRYRLQTSPISEYYDRELYWPKENLSRRQAILPAIEAYQATLSRIQT
jgi:hypothetical protein